MSHANAPLTPVGRARLVSLIIDQGWTIRRAAERFQVAPATASKWVRRYLAGEPLTDRSSRPRHTPTRTPQRTDAASSRYVSPAAGPRRIAFHLHLSRSTVERVLRRYRMPVLVPTDHATGLPVRVQKPARYEHPAPGTLSTSTPKNSAVSPTVAVTASMDGVSETGTTTNTAAATPTSTTQSTTTPGWCTPKSSKTNALSLRPGSGAVLVPGSSARASRCGGCSPITGPATGQRCSTRRCRG